MVRREIVELSSDLDGSPADETVSFGLDSRMYEVDLSEEQAEALRTALAPYVRAGRRAVSTRTHHMVMSSTDDSRAIRAWAAENGYQVSSRGRIPAEVREAYAAR